MGALRRGTWRFVWAALVFYLVPVGTNHCGDFPPVPPCQAHLLLLIRAGKRGGAASHLEVPSPEVGKPSQCSLEQPQAFWAIPGGHSDTHLSGGSQDRGTALLCLFCQGPFTLGSHSCLPDILKDPNTHFNLPAPSHPIFVRCCAKHLPELSFILMTLRLRVIGE